MNTKEKIIDALEGGRAKRVWELIEKSYLEVFEGTKKEDLEIAKEEYFQYEKQINNELNRYLIIEHYNFGYGFYFRSYKNDKPSPTQFEEMFEDFFSSNDEYGGGWEEVLIIDMLENQSYLFNKKIKYIKQEIEIDTED